MTTMELRQSLLQEIANIIDSDELTRKTLEYIRKLRAKEDLAPYTTEEINSWINEAEADIAAGRVYTVEEIEAEEQKLSFLGNAQTF